MLRYVDKELNSEVFICEGCGTEFTDVKVEDVIFKEDWEEVCVFCCVDGIDHQDE